MANDLVSVVVPTYNRAYCVGRAIKSVRAQSHSNWELLLIDDGSTDNTGELIAAQFGSDPRIRYIRQANAGVSAARNAGLAVARGNFIAFLDSDDIWMPWKLELQLACFRTFPGLGMVWTEFEAVDATGKIVMPRYLRSMYAAYRFFPTPESLFSSSCPLSTLNGSASGVEPGTHVYIGYIYTAMLRGNLVHTSTVMLSRDRMEKVQGFDVGLAVSGEDYDFHFRTCKWGNVCFIDVPSTTYQLEYEDRLTRHKRNLAENFLRTVQKAIALEKGTGQFPPSMVREVLAEAHGWIAEEMFRTKVNAGAWQHAAKSLRYKIGQPRMISLLGMSLIPRRVSDPILQAYRRVKRGASGKS